jgi:hypothetical protein
VGTCPRKEVWHLNAVKAKDEKEVMSGSDWFLTISFGYVIVYVIGMIIFGVGKKGWRDLWWKMKYWYCNVVGHDFSDERLRSFHAVVCRRCMGKRIIEYEKGERFP